MIRGTAIRTTWRPLLTGVILVVTALVLRGEVTFSDDQKRDPSVPTERFTLADVRELFPRAETVEHADGDVYVVHDADGAGTGTVVYGPPEDRSIIGFVGRVPILIGLDTEDRVLGVHLLPSRETDEYAQTVARELGNAWNDLSAAEAAALDVDTVSGATSTSYAVIEGVAATLESAVLPSLDPEREARPPKRLTPRLGDVLVVGFLGVSLMTFLLPRIGARLRLRLPLLALAVLIPGLLANTMLSLPLAAAWLRGAFSWRGHGLLLFIGLLAVAFPLLRGRHYYCYHYCPYGAAQELAGKMWRGRKTPGPAVRRLAGILRLVLLAAALGILLLDAGIDLAGFEPFAAFYWTHAPWASLVLAGSFLLLSVWTPRPWCRICPTGGLLEGFRRSTRRGRRPEEVG